MIIFPIFDVGEEALYDGRGDDVADVVCLGVPLEGDADDFLILDDGAAGVPGVNGGVNLDDEVGI